MPAYHMLYWQSVGRILSLVHNVNADTPVPAGWTVRNTLAHCLGMLADISAGKIDDQGRDLPMVRTVALFYLNVLDHARRLDGVPPLQIVTEDKRIDIGGDNPDANVTMSWWEISRVVSGRRSPKQVRALMWNVNPTPWIDELFVFGPRETPLDD